MKKYIVEKEELYEGWQPVYEADDDNDGAFEALEDAEKAYIAACLDYGVESVRLIQVILYLGDA